jgi:predicted nuclease of predicted toxin-antitoxin system
MLRLLTDENFNYKIVRGLRTRIPALDCLTVQEANLRGSSDEQLLRWATEAERVLLTHDIQTMPAYALARIEIGLLQLGL